MNLSECPVCRVGSVWNTGVCPVCPAPRMPVVDLSELQPPSEAYWHRRRILDRLWRSARTKAAVDWYAALMHTSNGER